MSPSPRPLRDAVAYLGVAYVLALAVAVGLPDARINLLLSVAIPTATVAALTFTVVPRGHRLTVWRELGLARAAFWVWPSAVAVPLALCSATYGAALLAGVGRVDVDTGATSGQVLDLLVSLAFGTVVILGEEIGWRGFLLPRVQQLTTRRKAAVLTGLAHGCSHLPLILLATTYDTGVVTWVAAPVAVAVITAGGVFYAWLWDRARTVWPVAVAHNVVNTALDLGAGSVVAVATGPSIASIAGETGFGTLAFCTVLALGLLRRARVWRDPTPVEATAGPHRPVSPVTEARPPAPHLPAAVSRSRGRTGGSHAW